MGWWWPWGAKKEEPLWVPETPVDRTRRKCKAFQNGLEGCRRANPSDKDACRSLELRLASCLCEDTEACKPAATEHRRCYTSLYKTGLYKGKGHCLEYESAMIKSLVKLKLLPAGSK